jgi:hypothetical protein
MHYSTVINNRLQLTELSDVTLTDNSRGVNRASKNARSRLWSMGPSPTTNYEDLPNISRIGVCEKILKKGVSPSRIFFAKLIFRLNLQATNYIKFYRQISNFLKKYRLFQKLGRFEFFS